MISNVPGFIQILITGSLLLHGIAHAIALIALIGQAATGRVRRRVLARSWLLPDAAPRSGARLLIPFWAVSTLLFFAASASSWGVLIPSRLWGRFAFIGAVISVAAVTAVAGIWPGSPSRNRAVLNSAVAMVMNLAILSARVWLQWLPSSWIIL